MPDRRRTAAIAVAVAATVSAGGVLALATAGGGEDSRQAAVAERGAGVMPFSLDATTHVFDATPTGGIQRVVADDPRNSDEIRLIRGHLRKEAVAFRRGDFADPASIHGEKMPGLAALQAGSERIDVGYRSLSDGAQIVYRSGDPDLVVALAEWFQAQLRDHGGDAKDGDDSEHSGHRG